MEQGTNNLNASVETLYRANIAWQYETVDTLGLPNLVDDRPMSLAAIYVPLSLTWTRNEDERFYLPDAIKRAEGRLAILGDPGAGKSMIVRTLAYSFGRIEPTPMAEWLGTRIPVPIILRDYPVSRWDSPDAMFQDYCKRLPADVQASVDASWLMNAIIDGRAALLIDGVDEVGGPAVRKQFRDNVFAKVLKAAGRDTIVIVTSRIIGYDDVPFDLAPHREDAEALGEKALSARSDDARRRATDASLDEDARLRRAYVAPFNDSEIDEFVTRWYRAREKDPTARVKAESLRAALRGNEAILRLARTPSLLTLIALIHRVTANLPSGRSRLYDKITEAYLETIQQQRGMERFDADLDQMRRWLADIGWRMQERRDDRHDQETDDQSGEPVLVGYGELLGWLTKAIEEDGGRADPVATARQFLDYVARRSGLLIPRGQIDGEEHYAFVHLTFQEYFAAWKLRGKIRHFNEIEDECRVRSTSEQWHETLTLLFELLAEFPGCADDLVKAIVKDQATSPLSGLQARLFVELLRDDQSGLGANGRSIIVRACLNKLFSGFGGVGRVDPMELAGMAGRDPATWALRLSSAVADDWSTIDTVWDVTSDDLGPAMRENLVALIETADALPPVERALCGRVLSALGDSRPGVGLRPPTPSPLAGRDGVGSPTPSPFQGEGRGEASDGLPDIEWCDVPAGEFVYGGDKEAYGAGPAERVKLDAFQIAKYPITYAQFQAFLDAPDGFSNPHWWDGLHAEGLQQQRKGPGGQAFPFANHPRENVSWYDAMAFCRWLSAKLGFAVTLPTEHQWEKAARGADGRIYPYGNAFDASRGNTDETGIGQTSAVGMFPSGASPCGAMDMSGNVFEWTLTEYEGRSDKNISSNGRRAVRGGAWSFSSRSARAAYRYYFSPGARRLNFGFRVVSPAALSEI